MDTSFSRDYAEAQEKFLGAARAVEAALERFGLDRSGPTGLPLSTDVA